MDNLTFKFNTYKISDLVVEILAAHGCTQIFGISGGASLHLLHSVTNNSGLNLTTMHHEQACAMAADGFARRSGRIGVAIATSGPGATNLITGIAGSFYDSIPTVFITGQVSTSRQKGNTGVRQIGFQETPIVQMVKEITKYSIQIENALDVVFEMEKALFLAKTGRPGPVLVDIPDDIQRLIVDVKDLKRFTNLNAELETKKLLSPTESVQLAEMVRNSSRPILVIGAGINTSGDRAKFLKEFESIEIPTLLTWGASDLLPIQSKNRVGTFGTHGSRVGNFTAENSDLIISIGSRLDTKATGSPVKDFAKNASIVMVDIDKNELNKFEKFGRRINLPLEIDICEESITQIFEIIRENYIPNSKWINFVQDSKSNITERLTPPEKSFVEPNRFFSKITEALGTSCDIFVDTGCAIAWVMNSLKVCDYETRIYHDFNNTAMGWALPALVGGLSAKKNSYALAVIGDGSFMMSMQELATLRSLEMDATILLLNNGGYSMIKQTQDQWFDGQYFASNSGRSMLFPDFALIAKSFGLNYTLIDSEETMLENLKSSFRNQGVTLCEVMISPNERVSPQVVFGSRVFDMDPKLNENEMKKFLL